MKRIVIACLLGALVPWRAEAAPGDLDASLGSGGFALVGSSTVPLTGRFVAVQSDGKILVVGGAENAMVVARFNSDGSVDTTVSNGGEVIITFDTATTVMVATAVGVAVQSDGKIVVAGSTHPLIPPQGIIERTFSLSIAVARRTAAGELDPTFGTGGKVTDVSTNSFRLF